MKPFPFRSRIALLSALISGGVLVAFGATAWYLMHRERVAALDREIRALAYRHPGWMGGRASYERLATAIEVVFGEDRKEQLILLVAGAGGEVRYRSPHWPVQLDPSSLDLHLEDSPASSEAQRATRRGPPWAPGTAGGRGRSGAATPLAFSKIPRFYTVTSGNTTWRVGVIGNGDERLVLGFDYADLQTELGRMRIAFLIALPLALLAIGGGGWWVAGQAMRPLRSIVQVAEGVTARGLDQRIPASAEDPEIARLIGVLNRMMDRLAASFRQATRFSADASHELKTPLTVMQGELEGALQGATPGSREQQVFADLLEQVQRLKSITRSLLLLAQADAGQLPLTRERVNLSAALGEWVEDLEALAAETRIRVELQAPAAIWVAADGSLLRQAVLNVLQNALRYNETDGWIRVALRHQEEEIELQVCNGGPGIPEADQPRLFDRFFRGDTARSRTADGAGLGLSLAREIARAHGGTLVLKESQPGRTCFVLSLPAQRPEGVRRPPE